MLVLNRFLSADQIVPENMLNMILKNKEDFHLVKYNATYDIIVELIGVK